MQNEQKSKPKLIAQSTIMERYKLTKRIIDKYFPPPILKNNPYYSSAPKMRLWEEEIVEQLVNTEEVRAAIEKANKTRETSKKALITKEQKMLALVQEKIKEISVDSSFSINKIKKMAIEDKNDWNQMRERYLDFAQDAPKEVKIRWAVNFVRHNLTNYDFGLYEMSGKVGCGKAYVLYKNAVLDKIAEAYPALKKECNRQKICQTSDENS